MPDVPNTVDPVKSDTEAYRNVIRLLTGGDWKKSFRNLQNVHTPFDLCYDIVHKLQGFCGGFQEKSVCTFNVEFVEVLISDFGVKPEQITFFTDCEAKSKFMQLPRFVGVKVVHGDFIQTLNRKDETMKNGHVIMNPPYNHQLHIKFLCAMLKAVKGGKIVTIQPAGWLLCERKPRRIIDLIRGKLSSVKLFAPKEVFGVEIGCLCGVFTIDTSADQSEVIVEDEKGKVIRYKNIDDVNQFGDTSVYLPLRKKIIAISRNDSLFGRVYSQGRFYVNVAKIRGHGDGNPDRLTFLTKNCEVERTPEQQYFGFEDEISATNFIKYLKTKTARFCLAILKSNLNAHQGELKYVPWIDFTKEWNDSSLQRLFHLTDAEAEFIQKSIPNYYDNEVSP